MVRIQPLPDEVIRAMLRKVVRLHNCIKGGRVAGPLTQKLGIGIFSETQLRNRNENARLGGKTTASIPGLAAKAGRLGGKTTAAIPGHMTKAAIAAGRANVESGHIAALGRLTAELQIGVHDPKVRERAASKGGKVQGAANVASGHLDNIRTWEVCSLGGKTNAHRNYHVARNRFNPKCDFCTGVLEDRNA